MCAILAASAAAFLACLALHVAIWRVWRPVGYRAWLPALVVTFLVGGSLLARWILASRLGAPDDPTVDRRVALAAVLLLHGSASGVYIIGYTLVSAFSPSIEILKALDAAPDGLRRTEIDVPFLRRAVGGDRVRNLLTEGMLQTDGDGVRLKGHAATLAQLALWYRHAIGLPDETGG